MTGLTDYKSCCSKRNPWPALAGRGERDYDAYFAGAVQA
jgi:hypothetical protein